MKYISVIIEHNSHFQNSYAYVLNICEKNCFTKGELYIEIGDNDYKEILNGDIDVDIIFIYGNGGNTPTSVELISEDYDEDLNFKYNEEDIYSLNDMIDEYLQDEEERHDEMFDDNNDY